MSHEAIQFLIDISDCFTEYFCYVGNEKAFDMACIGSIEDTHWYYVACCITKLTKTSEWKKSS